MEMMIVLLIIAIVAAASAPMISKKMVRSTGNDSPWVWTTMTGTDIGFNLKGADASASIGAAKAPGTTDKPRLFIKTKQDTKNPQIMLGYGDKKANIQFYKGNFWFSDEAIPDSSTTTNTVAIGSGAEAIAHSSVAIGDNANVGDQGIEQVSIGSGAKADKMRTIAIGTGANATKYNMSLAVGANATAGGAVSTVVGANATAAEDASYSIAIGSAVDSSVKTEAKSSKSIAMGFNAKAGTNSTVGENTIAIGSGANAVSTNAVAMGTGATALNTNAVALGSGATAYTNSIAISAGDNPTIAGSSQTTAHSIAIGHNVTALYQGIAIGKNIKADMIDSIVVGTGSGSSQGGYDSLVIGKNSWAKSPESIALGHTANAGTDGTHGVTSVAIGSNTTASQNNSIAIGSGATASNNNSVAIGPGATTTADNQIVLGVGPGSDGTGGTTVDIPGTFAVSNLKADNITVRPETKRSLYLGDTNYGVAIPKSLAVDLIYPLNGSKKMLTLGDLNTTVYIPGSLYVGRNVILNGASVSDAAKGHKYYTRMFIKTRGSEKYRHAMVRSAGSGDWSELQYSTSGNSDLNLSTGEWSSDRRLKNVGEVFKGGLEEIKKIEVFNYTFKKDKDKTPRVGVMAQDLQKIFPKAVFKGEDGFLRIRMEDMFYAMVNAIKELDRKVEMLIENQKRITELEKELKDLRKDYDSLEKRIQKLEKKRWNKDVE